MQRILTVQDISCVGKCSLTVALPIISACGVETAILPTAVLSTHTQFKNFTFRDLTDDLEGICNHWKSENLTFDGIYTGYLGSLRQINIVADIFEKFKTEDNFILVDPAMADNGQLYKGFDKNFALNMGLLCKKADIIVPNITEACFMLDIPYPQSYDEKYIKELLKKLTGLGAKIAVLTGVSFDDKHLGVYAYNSVTKQYFHYYREHLPINFHGTGDIFASAFAGALTVKKDLLNSIKIATDYTVESMKKTLKNKNHNWYGVDFENAIPYLTKKIKA